MNQAVASKTDTAPIERIFARTGTAEIASDPMPPNISDGYIMLKPMAEWPEPRKTRDELLAAIQEVIGKIPGNNYEFSQPIQLRFNELISGVRSDVAVKIFGDDMDVLNKSAEEVSAMLQKIQGSSEVKVEQTTGLPMLTVNIDRQKAARYGLNVADIQDTVATAIGGVFCKVDITSEDSVVAGFAKARAAHGQERVVVHCAMTSRRGKTLAFDKEAGKLKRRDGDFALPELLRGITTMLAPLAADVVRLRGSLQPEYTLAQRGAAPKPSRLRSYQRSERMRSSQTPPRSSYTPTAP